MSALLRIGELANLICSRSAGRKVIALLRAYFDDTGTHRDSLVVGVAGMIGEVSDWSLLEQRWFAKLAEYDLSDFHAAYCENAAPEYSHLKSTERGALVRELANIIIGCDFLALSAAVKVASWQSIVVESPGAADFLERYQKPFFLCFEYCVQMGSHWSRDFQSASPFAVVFNEQDADATMASEIFGAYAASKMWGGQLSTLTFAPRRDCAPLQAADLVAHEAYQAWYDILHGTGRPEREAMRILGRKEDFRYYRAYDDLGLSNAVKSFQANHLP